MNSYNLYTKTPIVKLFFMVALPGAISMIASSLWGLFDGIFVGKIIGDTAFSALNLAFPFVVINFSLADLIGVGSAVSISIALGKKENDKANNYFTCACIMILVTGAAMGAIMFLCAPLLIKLLGADGEFAALAVHYLRVYAVCSPFCTIIFAVDNFLRICGRIKTSMFINIFMSALILGLEYLFLAVFKMGIGGSAFAVSLGMFICALIAFFPFFRKKLTLKFCKPHFSLNLIKRIVAGGSPNFLNNIAARITSIVMNSILLSMGGQVAVSAYGILMYAGDIIQQLMYGSCDSLQPAIGYNWGSESKRRVSNIVKCCFTAAAVICIGGAAVIYFFPEQIASLFIKENSEELLPLSVRALKIYSLTYITRWFGFVVQSFLIAIEKPVPATVLSVSNALVLPLILIAAFYSMGLDGLWLNTPVTSLVVSILAAVIYVKIKKSAVNKKPSAE